MAVFSAQTLINNLRQDLLGMQQAGTALRQLDLDLNVQPQPGAWSVAQVLEHLNSYNRYYIPQLQQAVARAAIARDDQYREGWLGGYFTRAMLPKQGGAITNKMQAPKDHRPPEHLDPEQVLREYQNWLSALVAQLDAAVGKDIGGVRIPITLTPLIRLKAGDTFRFLIAHMQRHWIQIHRITSVLAPEAPLASAETSFSHK